MLKHKLLVIDLDNTLVQPPEEMISSEDAKAIVLCLEHLPVVLASARPPRSMKSYWQRLGLRSPCIAYNGGLVWDYINAQPLKGWYIEREKLQVVLNILKTNANISVWLESEDRWITNRLDAEPVQLHIKRGSCMPETGEVNEWIDKPINKAILFGDVRENLISSVREIGLNVLSYVHPEMTEVRPLNVDKGNALLWLCNYLNIPPEEVLCIGDDINDLAMFNVSGLSVAMGNSADLVKQTAKDVTLSISDHGVAYAIKKHVLA